MVKITSIIYNRPIIYMSDLMNGGNISCSDSEQEER